MRELRAVTAIVAGLALVYVLYLNSPGVALSALLTPSAIALVSACVVSSIALFQFSRMARTKVEALSEGRRWIGRILFAAGILIYLLGTNSDYAALLHWVSLWIIIPSLTILLLGIRNSAFALPALPLLFIVVPTVPSTVVRYELALPLLLSISILALIALSDFFPRWMKLIAAAPFTFEPFVVLVPSYALIGILVSAVVLGASSVMSIRGKRREVEVSCEFDTSAFNATRRGCANCGRIFEGRGSQRVGNEVLILTTVMLVAVLIGFVSLPLVTVTSNDVNITTVGPAQRSSVPLIVPPPGFLENSSAPSQALEKQYAEQLVVLKQFFPAVHPENFSYTIYLEANPSYPFFVKHWEYLGGYNRTTEIITTNGSSPVTVYSTLLRANGTAIVAISYDVPVWVVSNGAYSTMNVGVSALARPSFEVTPQGYETLKRQMMLHFVVPETRLAEASVWTQDISRASATTASVWPFVPLGAGTTLVLGLMGFVLSADRRGQVMLDAVGGLSYDDRRMLATALRLGMNRRPKSGAQLLSGFNSSTSRAMTPEAFYSRLEHLEELGYFRQTPVVVKGKVLLFWRLVTP